MSNYNNRKASEESIPANQRNKYIAQYSNWQQQPYYQQDEQLDTYGDFRKGSVRASEAEWAAQSKYEASYYKNQKPNSNKYTLNQLKKQYEILRDLPMNINMGGNHSHKQSQNQQASVLSYSSSQKSLRTSEVESSARNNPNSNYNVLVLEKQQLQLVISNSMKKIQELLNKQAENKRLIHQLQLQKDKYLNNNESQELTQKLSVKQRRQHQLSDEINKLQIQIQALMSKNKQFLQRVRYNQTKIKDYQYQNEQLLNKLNQVQNNCSKQKIKYSQLQMQCIKIRRQCKITVKDYEEIISMMKREQQRYVPDKNSEVIVKLQRQLEYQHHKFRVLQDQFKNYKIQKQKQIKHFQNRIRQAQNQHSNNTVQNNAVTMEIIQNLREQSANNRKNSLNMISQTINKLSIVNQPEAPPPPKNQREAQLMAFLIDLRQEIRALKEPTKKNPPKEDFALKKNYHELLYKFEHQRTKLQDIEKKNSKLTTENIDLNNSHHALQNNYEASLGENQLLKSQLNSCRKQLDAFKTQREKFRGSEDHFETQLHNMRKQLDKTGFDLNKVRQETEFQKNQIRTSHQSETRWFKEQLSKGERDRKILREQLNKMKSYYDNKMMEKTNLLQNTINQYTSMLQNNDKSHNAFKNHNEHEINELIRKLRENDDLSDRYMGVVSRNGQLERQLMDIKQIIPQLRGLNENVEHLWVIKETEYKNVHDIFSELRRHL